MKKQASDMGRRQLLKALAIGSAAGAVATVSGQAWRPSLKHQKCQRVRATVRLTMCAIITPHCVTNNDKESV